MGVSRFGPYFRACHAHAAIGFLDHVFLRQWLGEAGPAGAAFEFIERTEEWLAADAVDVDAGFVIIPVFVAEGRLGAAFFRDVVLLWSEAFPQFGIGHFLCFRCGGGGFFGFVFLRHGSIKEEECSRDGKDGREVKTGCDAVDGGLGFHRSFRYGTHQLPIYSPEGGRWMRVEIGREIPQTLIVPSLFGDADVAAEDE